MKNTVIEVLVPLGEPSGLKIVRLTGWIGKAFIIPRKDLKLLKDFEEKDLPAVYFLFGEGIDNERLSVYIGQTDNFFRRINQQNSNKDDWNIAVVFTGESDIDVQYLERLCVDKAKVADRYSMRNGNIPSGRQLSSFRVAANQDFFEKMIFITALLGFPLFQNVPKEDQSKDIYYLEDKKKKDAFGKGTLLESGEFVVFAGSKARIVETISFKKRLHSVNFRKLLMDEGVLVLLEDKSAYGFVKDYTFKSPSAAADTIMARACNGWTSWQDKNGRTLDENKRN